MISGPVARSPGWVVSTFLQWHLKLSFHPINAVPIDLSSVQNPEDRVTVKGRQHNLTHEC